MYFGLSALDSDMGSCDDYDPEYSDPDACLNPVDRLEKYVESEYMYSRQLAARSLLETLQQVDEFSDAERFLKVLSTLASDADGVVRTELSEQLAQIGNACVERQTIFTSGDISYDPLTNDILPIIFRYMIDPNNQVRKASQAALADLAEQRLVAAEDFVLKVSPIISRLADVESPEELRSEGASLLCRLAPIVGAELSERLFLDHFLNLCRDHVFQIRKICAISFGSICQVTGREKTESLLLEKFFCLCVDAIWGVRKACAECFVQVSSVCSPAVRHSQLSAAFINLLADQSRWVRMAAFEALGGFISTFADPNATGLRLTEEGILVMSEPSVVFDEKRRNGDLTENVEEIVSDLKEELIRSVDNMTCIMAELQPGIETDSREAETLIASDCVQGTDENSNKSLHFSGPYGDEAVSDLTSQDMFCAVGNIDAVLSEKTEVQGHEVAVDNQITCNKEQRSDDLESMSVDSVHALEMDEHSASNTSQQGFENGVESESLHIVSENCSGNEEVRWDLNEVVDQNADISGNMSGNVLLDESLPVNDHVSTAADLTAVDICQHNELTNARASTIDTCELDICLESNVMHTAADETTQQFGSLGFWQQMVSKASHPEGSNGIVALDSLFSFSDSEVASEAQNLLSSKLLDSVCHLSNSVATVNLTDVANHVPFAGNIENGEIKVHEETDSDVQSIELLVENSGPKLAENLESVESVELNERDSVPCMKYDDENCADAVAGNENLTLISEAETVEIPLSDESTGRARKEECRPLLRLLDDLTDPKDLDMDFGEAIDLENGVEVDDEEISELVAAAKDVLCNDVAIYEQDIVPSDLLEQYLGMMDPSCAQTVDGEITRHCAYSFPAVAYTMGRKNWSSLKNLYSALAADIQWKVRRTLAFSIHELALIVGEEITSRDLVPVFDGFLNDLDEVRIGVLVHLADFLKLLPVDVRRDYLLKIAELLKTDNSRNWRFRRELAGQLLLLLDLFTVTDIHEHILPIALLLADDRVMQVRLAAVRVLSCILKRLVECADKSDGCSVWTSYLDVLTEQFVRSSRYTKRQMFVHLCNCILQDRVISEERFADNFLPILLSLRHDVIPNVRLTLARVVAQHIKHSEFFLGSKNPHHEEVRQTISALQEDRDRDVRLLINVKPDDFVECSSVETIS